MNSIFKITFILASFLILSCGDNKSHVVHTKQDSIAFDSIYNKGVYIDHNVFGKGKYTLLFVHGWCINQSYWSKQIESLMTDYKIVTIDLPGFGKSGKNRDRWTIEAYGEDINSIIKQLNLSNVILVGHSMGGDIILESALKNKKVVALIGVDNFKEVGVEFSEELKAEVDGFIEMLKNNFSEIAPGYAEGFLFHQSTDSLIKKRVIKDFISCDSTIAIASLKSIFEYAVVETKQLSKLKQKLYLINSDATPTNQDGLKGAEIDFEVIEINATGHYPMIEKPTEFNKVLKQTIQKIEVKNNKGTEPQSN